MKSKNMTLMAIAIGCGLVAAVLTAKLSGGSAPDTIDIIVAKKELPVGTILDEKELDSLLGTSKMPRASVPPDTITNVEELKGKRVNRTMRPGNYFSPGDVGADAGIKIPEGMFKYAIKMDGVKAVAGFVEPGAHVDVILTESQPNGKVKSGNILRDILVLAVDTSARPNEGGYQGRQTVNSVSVAVSVKQSLILSSAEKRGEVKLLLRDTANLDHKDTETVINIEGYDEKALVAAPVAPLVKTVSVIFTKAEVPMNTLITNDNFDKFFSSKDVPEELVNGKAIKDRESLRGKYITQKLEADMIVFGSWLSDSKIETEKPAVATADPKVEAEVLPTPREKEVEKPLYPRKFEQIINNQRIWFMETGPGEFRRVEGGADLKEVPTTNGATEKKEEKKTGEARGDRAA